MPKYLLNTPEQIAPTDVGASFTHTARARGFYAERSMPAAARSRWQTTITVVSVALVHVLALGLVLYSSQTDESIQATAPTIAGVLIQQRPTPVEPPKVAPKPKPKPKPIPKPKPKPIPKPQPIVEQAPVPEPVIEEQQDEPPVPPPVVQQIEEPVVEPPRTDAQQFGNPAPRYPRTSIRLKEEGTVLLELLVLRDGSVGEVHVKISSGFPRLDRAALKAVKRWHYLPAQQAGEAIDFWYEQPVVFALRD